MERKSPGGAIVARASLAPGQVRLTVDKASGELFAEFLRDEPPLLLKRFFARESGGGG